MSSMVTVIIPNYNKSMYLEQCIKSVAAQTYRPLEILVVDDASKDSSLQVLSRLQERFPILRVVALKQNGGVSHARNVGIESAKGEILTMLDSDDFYINPQKIENEVRALETSQGKLAFAYSKTVLVNEDGLRMQSYMPADEQYLTGNVLKLLLKCKGLNVVPRDYCFHRKITEDITVRYNEKMNFFEDTEFLLKIAAKATAICTYQEGTAYRQNTNGLSNKPEKTQYRKRWEVSWKNLKLLLNPVDRFGTAAYLIVFRISFELKLLIKKIVRKRGN